METEEGEKKPSGQEKTTYGQPSVSLVLPSLRGRYSAKQCLNYPTNIIYTYNPSTTPWGTKTSLDVFFIIIIVFSLPSLPKHNKVIPAEQTIQISLSMAIENVELMHESSPQHLHMGTARMKEREEEKQKMMNMGKK